MATKLVLPTGTKAPDSDLIDGVDSTLFMRTTHAANAITGFGTSGTATLVSRNDHTHTAASGSIIEDSTHRFVTDAQISTWNATEFRQSLNSIRQNLGSPTVQEMALFQSQFNNKFEFLLPTLIEDSTDGTTWNTSVTKIPSSNAIKDMMIGRGVSSGGFVIPRGEQTRLTWNNLGPYVYLNYFYTYWVTMVHTCKIMIEGYTTNTGLWTTIVTTVNSSGWPAHISVPHTSIPFSTATSQYSKVRVTFIPTWSTDSANPYYNSPITIYSIEWWGGFPAAKRDIYAVDRDKNVTFPAYVYGTQLYDGGTRVALSTHNHDGVYEPANANIQLHIYKTDGVHGATPANTALTIVERDASGNFIAGTITATLAGNADTATKLKTSRLINGVAFDGSADITVPVNPVFAADITVNGITVGRGAASINNTVFGQNALLVNTIGDSNVAIGNNTLTANTGGAKNVAVGDSALYSNKVGSNNVAVGYNALYFNTNSKNTAIGESALYKNASGANNVAIGYEALMNANTSKNVAIGDSALYTTQTGGSNVGIGYYALYLNKASKNTAIGDSVLSTNVWGECNVGIGYEALCKNTASYNIAIGDESLHENTSGGNNVAIGYNTLHENTTGKDNIAIGYTTAIGNKTGIENVAIGYQAMYTGPGGDYNVAIGSDVLYSNTDGDFNVAIGNQCSYYNTTGYFNVAIGVAALKSNLIGANNVAIGENALQVNLNNNNTAVGSEALSKNTSGLSNTAIGYQALFNNTTYNYATGIGCFTDVTGDFQNQIGGTNTTTYTYGAVQNRSDKRDKTDITNTALGLNFISQLRPVDFRWDYREDYFNREEYQEEYTFKESQPNPNFDETLGDSETNRRFIEVDVPKTRTAIRLIPVEKDGSRKRTRKHHGLIAQEVKAVMDNLQVDFAGYQDHSINGGKDVLSIGYAELIAPMIKAIQEQQQMIEELKTEVANLKTKMT